MVNYVFGKMKEIYPLYIFSMLLMILLTYESYVMPEWEANPFNFLVRCILHIFLLQSFIPKLGVAYAFNGPAWYLSVCVLLWFLSPIFIYLIDKIKNQKRVCIFKWSLFFTLLCYQICIYSMQLSEQRWFMYVNPVVNCLIFLEGMLSAKELQFSDTRNKFGTDLYLLILVLLISIKNIVPIDFRIVLWLPTVSGLVSQLYDHKGICCKILSYEPLCSVGKISLEIFLIHYALCSIFNTYLDFAWYMFILCFISCIFIASILKRIRLSISH